LGGLKSLQSQFRAGAKALPSELIAGAKALPQQLIAGAKAFPQQLIAGAKALPQQLGAGAKNLSAQIKNWHGENVADAKFLFNKQLPAFGKNLWTGGKNTFKWMGNQLGIQPQVEAPGFGKMSVPHAYEPLQPIPQQGPLKMVVNTPEGPQGTGAQGTRGHEDQPLLRENGRFQDPKTEAAYQKYIERNDARSRRVRDRLEWKEVSDFTKDGPMGRGNKFNETVKERGDYPHDEVHLENGKRVDSYKPPELDSSGKITSRGEIVSRKAIDFDNIKKDSDFTKHLIEMESKYSAGTKIRSDKYSDLDGKTLEGQQILEVPRSNMSSTKKEYYEQLASEKGIEIRYVDEY
jgi:hypothetical protein